MAILVLGLLFWITQISFISIHMLLGLTGALSLLVLGTVAVFTRGLRPLGAGSMVYAFIVPAFGLTQSLILVGNLHWLIQTAHLLVGIGAMALAQVIDKRYQRLRHPHPRFRKSVLPVGGDRAKAATRSLTLFWGGEGKRKKTVEKPRNS
jgi:hypothetical protein